MSKTMRVKTCSAKIWKSARRMQSCRDVSADKHSRSDYATNELLDRYSDADINDEEQFGEMSVGQRRAAEQQMARRDRRERAGRRGGRAAARSRMPQFLESDDAEDEGDIDGGLLSGMKRRTRRQYDERRDIDDMDGIEDVRSLLHST
jgi:DNA replication licensing factor MCM2